jgi:hypothetical protein
LRMAQQMPAPAGNGLGIVAAARDAVTSGFGFKLFRRLHIGATSWNVFGQLGFNPYYASPLRIEGLSRNGTNIQFHFHALANREYRVEYSANLAASNWNTLITLPISLLSTNHLITMPYTAPNRFYRISAH